MEADFWHNMWENNKLGFHLNDTNKFLINNFDKLNLEENKRIFVPLCGKSHDIAWLLSQGHDVVGAELSEIAIQDLFHSLGVKPNITNVGKLKLYSAQNIDIFVGDIFDLDKNALGNVDAIYDRAAIVALPPQMREKYTKLLMQITNLAKQLVITLEYEPSKKNGPPFSVDDNNFKSFYEDFYKIKLLDEGIDEGFKPLEVIERVWHLY
jgi:thiopurine S-methyltransferase